MIHSVMTHSHNAKQHNDKQHNDTQHNDTQHNDTRHNNTQHDTQFNDTQHNDAQLNTLHNDTQHYNSLPLCSASHLILISVFSVFMLNVTIPSVMVPWRRWKGDGNSNDISAWAHKTSEFFKIFVLVVHIMLLII